MIPYGNPDVDEWAREAHRAVLRTPHWMEQYTALHQFMSAALETGKELGSCGIHSDEMDVHERHRLQGQIDKLEQENQRLRELLAVQADQLAATRLTLTDRRPD